MRLITAFKINKKYRRHQKKIPPLPPPNHHKKKITKRKIPHPPHPQQKKPPQRPHKNLAPPYLYLHLPSSTSLPHLPPLYTAIQLIIHLAHLFFWGVQNLNLLYLSPHALTLVWDIYDTILFPQLYIFSLTLTRAQYAYSFVYFVMFAKVKLISILCFPCFDRSTWVNTNHTVHTMT